MIRQSHTRSLVIAALLALPCTAFAFNQAPALAKLVQEKKLPPLEQRIPEKPQVVKPVDKVGVYGGGLRSAMRANADQNSITRIVGVHSLTRWSMDFNKVEPNLAESWDINKDASEYTFNLRKGTRWSDGSPFTADDVVFAMNDIVYNKQFFPLPPEQYVANNKIAEVTKVDDYRVKFKFSGPNLAFTEHLATGLGQHPTFYQKKYCSQFHPKYNPKVGELVEREKLKEWGQLMRLRCADLELPARWGNAERPTLDPWVIKDQPYGAGATRVVLERNPYFWQVDTAGNQLPYIDTLNFAVISEVETIVLAAINGQLDYQHRHIFSIQNRPVLSENAAKGNYKVMTHSGTGANSVGLWLNHSTKNEKLRKLVRNKEFRIALSHGVDRKEVRDIVYLGQGIPWQTGPLKQSRWYNEKLATQYLEHDVKLANEKLDQLGLTKRDADGYRQYPEGGRITMFTIVSLAQAVQIEALELIRKQWQKIGIEMAIVASERSLFYDRAQNNDYDISVDIVPGGMDITMNPRSVVSAHPLESRVSIPWTRWNLSDGKQGEEPPASMKKRIELYQKWQIAKTQTEAEAAFKELLAIAADEFEMIGVIRSPSDTAIRNVKLTNVYEQMLVSWTYPNPSPALPQQWFFAK